MAAYLSEWFVLAEVRVEDLEDDRLGMGSHLRDLWRGKKINELTVETVRNG